MIHDLLTDPLFWMYAGIGFAAQIVDGALGMAYGTLCTAILIAMGTPPATVSVSVHSAQFFTTGISGLSHAYFKNIDRRLVLLLTLSGAIGGILGALLLTHIDGKALRPYISLYLLFLGMTIGWKMLHPAVMEEDGSHRASTRRAGILGLFGGFLDALGGGWGPIMTSTLLRWGVEPRLAIGSVNTAEFFVKTVIALTLAGMVDADFHRVVLGLLTGGIIAAPLGAYILRFIKPRILIGLVAALVIALSLLGLAQTIFG